MSNIIKIIKAVQARECIWNTRSPGYAKRDRLEKAWREIAEEVGKTDTFCREKWRNVRTGFLRSIHSYASSYRKNNAPGELQPRRKRFYLHDEMEFLLLSEDKVVRTTKRQRLPKKVVIQTTEDDSNDCHDINATVNDHSRMESMESFEHRADPKQESILMSSDRQELEAICNETLQAEEIMADFIKVAPEAVDALMNTNIDSNLEQTTPNNRTLSKCGDENINITPNESIHLANNNPYTSTNKDSEDWDCGGRDERQLLAFFRGNIDDILTLSKPNQRLFKRRVLELIDELHYSESVGA